MRRILQAGRPLPPPVASLRRFLARVMTIQAAVLMVAAGLQGPTALDGSEDDLGARSLKEDSWSTPVLGADDITRFGPVVPMTPPMDELYRDPVYYTEGCHVWRPGTEVLPGCLYGDVDSEVTVAVVGNSKIGQYFPALEEIARREGWALRMYTKSSCAFVDEPDESYPACEDYKEDLRAELAADREWLAQRLHQRRELGLEGGIRSPIVQLDAVERGLPAQGGHVLFHKSGIDDQVVQPIGAQHPIDHVADLHEDVSVGNVASGLRKVGNRSVAGQGGSLQRDHGRTGRHVSRLLGVGHKADTRRLGLCLGDQIEAIQAVQLSNQV